MISLFQFHRGRSWSGQDLTLEPSRFASEEQGGFRLKDANSRLQVRAAGGSLPNGWVLVDWKAVDGDGARCPVRLIVHAEESGPPVALFDLNAYSDGKQLLRLPDKVHEIKLHAPNGVTWLRLERFRMQPLSKLGALWLLVRPHLNRQMANPRLWRKACKIFLMEGLNGVRARLLNPSHSVPYDTWIEQNETLGTEDRRLIADRIAGMPVRPTISVVMPTYNTPERWLRRAIESVQEQVYPHWELCIADDASPNRHVVSVIAEYQARDPRIKLVRRPANGHIAAATNSALEIATGDFVALLDHDDELHPHALYMVAEEINKDPGACLIYSDEDKIDERGRRYAPYFKPDWNPDLMLSHNMITHLAVFRHSVIREVDGFRPGYDGSQDYDLMLRVIERVGPRRIRHIPHVLYHWRAIQGSTALDHGEKLYAHDVARKVIKEHLERTGHPDAVVTQAQAGHYGLHRVIHPVPEPAPRVDIIIPTKDRIDLLRCCIDSILQKTLYPNYRILIVDNRSEEEASRRYFAEVVADPRVSVIQYDAPYNFAALNNWAVERCDAPLIAFVNNDIEVISPGWLGEMVGHALRPEIGPVGAKLYYPDDTIQHGGVIVGLGGLAAHAHHRLPRTSPGFAGRALLIQNYSAVTAACLVLRRELFESVGGFDAENFGIAYNDVDLCLRLGKRGYRSLWTPYAELYHHESASLGDPHSQKRQTQFLREAEAFRTRWAGMIEHDPAYNPNLTRSAGDFALASDPRLPKPWRALPNTVTFGESAEQPV